MYKQGYKIFWSGREIQGHTSSRAEQVSLCNQIIMPRSPPTLYLPVCLTGVLFAHAASNCKITSICNTYKCLRIYYYFLTLAARIGDYFGGVTTKPEGIPARNIFHAFWMQTVDMKHTYCISI